MKGKLLGYLDATSRGLLIHTNNEHVRDTLGPSPRDDVLERLPLLDVVKVAMGIEPAD